MGCTCTATPCGDLYTPPSRSNMTLFAIIELVCMGVIGILCAIDLIDLIKYLNSNRHWTIIPVLKVIEYVLIVVGLVLVLIGLFCSVSQSQIRTGILCFCIGCILAIVILVLIIYYGYDKDSLLFNICYMILLIFLAYFLWMQSGRL